MVFHPRAMGVVFLRLHETRELNAENGMDSRTMLLFYPSHHRMKGCLAPRERFELPRERAHAISSRAHYQAMRSRLSPGHTPPPFNHHP